MKEVAPQLTFHQAFAGYLKNIPCFWSLLQIIMFKKFTSGTARQERWWSPRQHSAQSSPDRIFLVSPFKPFFLMQWTG
jgi:hypothetical protein